MERPIAPLAAELARPDHAGLYDGALEHLDLGTDRPESGWRTPGL